MLIKKKRVGFKKNHRTSDNLLTLKNVVKKYVTIGQKKLYTCFIDLKKAYDSVWHEGLFYKMEENGFSGKMVDLIRDIYRKTKCSVRINDCITDYFNYTRGVRQGCPLSPILFNLYADDLIIISETKEGLQTQLNKLNTYCLKWKLEVNIKKN